MKKITYITMILCTAGIFNSLYAQNADTPTPAQQDVKPSTAPTGYAEVSFGMAIPTGNFAKESGENYGEYALLGNNFNISLGIPVHHSNFGVALMYGSFSNFFDMNTYVNNIQANDPTKFYSPIKGDEYDESVFMAGFFATYPVHRFSFDFRIMGGIAFCYLPEVDYGANPVTEGTYNYEWDTHSSTSSSFVYDAGVDVRYKVRRMSVMFGVDFISANPTVNTTQLYIDPNGNYLSTQIHQNVSMPIVSVDIGVAYRIR